MMPRRFSFYAGIGLLVGLLSLSIGPGGVMARPAPTAASLPFSNSSLYLPIVARNWCQANLIFTYVPPYGSFDDLKGLATCIDPAAYRVAVYIFVSGWFTKPYWASPLTSIAPDRTWSCDITTGSNDELATYIAAFLVPANYDPPQLGNAAFFPDDLYQHALTYTMVERATNFRTIHFSGYTWKVKASEERISPGPNYFSDRPGDVFVDGTGRLHLWIAYHNGRWYSTEVIAQASLGYGHYDFHLASRIDTLDANAVLGLFTWDDAPLDGKHREIDIEFSRWSQPAGQNAQYVVQPWDTPGNRYQFNMNLLGDLSTHCFEWRAGQITFNSRQGDGACPGAPDDQITTWNYTGGSIPNHGAENPRINLWLNNGLAPANNQPIEVIIDRFEFTP